jgi:hypothetical protein
MRFGIRSAGFVFGLLALLADQASAQAKAGIFASVEGTVELQRGAAGAQRPTVGAPLLVKDELQVGDAGRVRVLLNDESLIDLASMSHLVVQSGGGGTGRGDRTTVKLDRGTMRARVSRAVRKSPGFEIETPTALVRTSDGDLIVQHRADDRSSEILCLGGRAQVRGTLGVIGEGVELAPGRSTRVQRGALPSAAREADGESVAALQRSLEIIGTGSDDHLDAGHALVTGHLLAPTDRPDLPRPSRAAAEGEYLRTAVPGETLLEQLSPDLRTNTQPIPEYDLTLPGEQPPPLSGD